MWMDAEVGWLRKQYVVIDALESLAVIQQYDSENDFGVSEASYQE